MNSLRPYILRNLINTAPDRKIKLNIIKQGAKNYSVFSRALLFVQ